jgi:hypothetical protein
MPSCGGKPRGTFLCLRRGTRSFERESKQLSEVLQSIGGDPHDLVCGTARASPEPAEGMPAGGAYVPTAFVGMYAPLGMSTPSQHFVHAQDRSVIPEIEPPTRPRPVARVLDQASFHGILDARTLHRPWVAYTPTKTVGTGPARRTRRRIRRSAQFVSHKQVTPTARAASR